MRIVSFACTPFLHSVSLAQPLQPKLHRRGAKTIVGSYCAGYVDLAKHAEFNGEQRGNALRSELGEFPVLEPWGFG
jgi:hypothetical protein